MNRSILTALALCAVAASPLKAQTLTVLPVQTVPAGSDHAIYGGAAYDSVRGRVVLRDGRGHGTWELDGDRWEQRSSGASPGTVAGPMAYDVGRQRTVLFHAGGTFEWDGFAWERKAPAQSPPATIGMAMAYDIVRGRTVLVSGNPLQTWEWDGSDWTPRTPANVPFAGAGPWPDFGLAYDLSRGVSVLYVAFTGQTWEWDGTDWSRVLTPGIPGGIHIYVKATYDIARSRVVLSSFNGLWEFDGQAWSLGTGSIRFGGLVVYDDQRGDVLAMPGGGNVFAWNGTRSAQLVGDSQPETDEEGVAMVSDPVRGRVVFLGGELEDFQGFPYPAGVVREWDGRSWHNTYPPVAQRIQAAMVFDPTAQRILLFGGLRWSPNPRTYGHFGATNDTWSYDGTTWTELMPNTRPPAGAPEGMVWERQFNRAVLMTRGGNGLETWEWSGSDWSRRTTNRVPPAIDAMAYDEAGRYTLAFTGTETWIYAGNDWHHAIRQTSPPPRRGAAMAFLPGLDRLVLYGGTDPQTGQPLDDAWQWTGDWTRLQSSAPLPTIARPGMAVDWTRGSFLVRSEASYLSSAPAYFLLGQLQPASASRYGQGCAGAGMHPTISASEPSFGNGHAQVELVVPNGSVPGVFAFSATRASTPLGPCTLLVGSPSIFVPVSWSGGSYGRVRSPLPYDPALRGLTVHVQGLVADLVAPLGLSTSQGLTLTVGD